VSRFAFTLVALSLMAGCLRFGYTPEVPSDEHSHHADAGGAGLTDADGGAQNPQDAATDSGAAGTAAMQGSPDAGAMDAGASLPTPCLFNVTMNTYTGSPHYHGFLALDNAGSATWTLITIEFDLRSNMYVCNDQTALPGAGWTLQSSGGHCVYIKTAPGLSLAPGATLTFEYSTDDPTTAIGPAVANISVSGCR
jgi:hypothetical protein